MTGKISSNIYTSKVTITDSMRDETEKVFDSGMFIMGEKVKEFEKKFASSIRSKYAVAVSNGTTAIELVLQSLDISKNDEVIVPSHTAFPTIEPILQVGAKPVFAEIDERTYTIDPSKIDGLVTNKTKAILPVHIYGSPVDMDPLISIAKKYNLKIVEDCCQAHDCDYRGKKVGTFGVAGCFSFYPSKNMTVCGDGGMIVTDDDGINRKVHMLRNHGQDGVYNHIVLGHNYRLSEIHCAIGIKQLEMLKNFTKRRREIASIYNEELKETDLILPFEPQYGKSVYHLYVVRAKAEKRDWIIDELKKKKIYCGIHYPIACHQQKAVPLAYRAVTLPITEKIISEIISLPIYPLLTDDEARIIALEIKKLLL